MTCLRDLYFALKDARGGSEGLTQSISCSILKWPEDTKRELRAYLVLQTDKHQLPQSNCQIKILNKVAVILGPLSCSAADENRSLRQLDKLYACFRWIGDHFVVKSLGLFYSVNWSVYLTLKSNFEPTFTLQFCSNLSATPLANGPRQTRSDLLNTEKEHSVKIKPDRFT